MNQLEKKVVEEVQQLLADMPTYEVTNNIYHRLVEQLKVSFPEAADNVIRAIAGIATDVERNPRQQEQNKLLAKARQWTQALLEEEKPKK